MRVRLDEQLPRQLAPSLIGHDVRTVQQQSWAGLKNGALLAEAEGAGFTVFLTGNQSLELLPLIPRALEAIAAIQAGQVVRVET
jgi:hypothetical protein